MIKNLSGTNVICYATPSKLQRTAAFASATENLIPKLFSSVSVSAMKRKINSKSFSLWNAMWTNGKRLDMDIQICPEPVSRFVPQSRSFESK